MSIDNTLSSTPLTVNSKHDEHATAAVPLTVTGTNTTGLSLELLRGNDDVLSAYLAARTYDYAALPSWLKDQCWGVAAEIFEDQNTRQEAKDWIVSSLSRRLNKPINAWICKNILQRSPAKQLALVEKYLLSTDTLEEVRPRLTERHFEQLCIPKVGTLASLNEQIESNFSTPDQAFDKFTKISADEIRSLLSADQSTRSMRGKVESLIPFSPFNEGLLGRAPRQAYTEITNLLICHAILSDILVGFDIELNAKQFVRLFDKLRRTELSEWQADPMLTKLINLSNEIRKDPSLTEHVSRMTAFSKYARYEDTIAALRYANSVKAQQKAHNPADAGVTFSSPDSAPSRNPVDQMLESIDTLLDEHEIDAGESDIVPLRIARLAVSQHISFEKLKRIMESCDFDNTAIMAMLKPEGKPKTIEPDAKDSSSLPQLNTLTPINLPSLALLIHAEGGKEPFTTWYNDLRDKRRQRFVTMYLDKLQREHPVDVKALSSAKPDGQVVGLYELRIHECGLRVYFRYVHNNRIILLGGGGKTNLNAQSRDITTCALRALQYNGRAAESAAALREWSKEQTDS